MTIEFNKLARKRNIYSVALPGRPSLSDTRVDGTDLNSEIVELDTATAQSHL